MSRAHEFQKCHYSCKLEKDSCIYNFIGLILSYEIESGMFFINNVVPEWKKAMKEMRTILNKDEDRNGEDALNLILNKFH